MTENYVSDMYVKALNYAAKNKGWFTATQLSTKVKCAKRTARFYCQVMREKGLVEKKNTYPSLTYRTITKKQKGK